MIGHRKLLIGVVGLLAGISSAAVFAQDEGQPVRIQGVPMAVSDGYAQGGLNGQKLQLSEHVSYSDLDLATPQGDHQLIVRLRNAATSICDRLGDMDRATTPMDDMEQHASCVNGAIDGAMEQVKQAERSAR